jgi:hypothetical protein
VNALADIFPAIQRLVGEDFFRSMARLYMSDEPPQSARCMFEYGHGFAAFLEHFEPVAKLPIFQMSRVSNGLARCVTTRRTPSRWHPRHSPPLRLKIWEVFASHRTRQREQSIAALPQSRSSRPAVRNKPLDQIKPLDAEDGLITRPLDEVRSAFCRLVQPFFEALIAGRDPRGSGGTTY